MAASFLPRTAGRAFSANVTPFAFKVFLFTMEVYFAGGRAAKPESAVLTPQVPSLRPEA